MSDIKLNIVDNCLYWLWTWISGWQYSTNLLEVLNLIGCCIFVLLFWYYELSRLFRRAYGSAIAVLRPDHPVVKRISSLPLRLLVAAPFVLLTAADMSISLYSWCTFGTTFNDGFAISVLQSDPDEVVKMLGCISLIYVLLLFIPSFWQ